MEYAYQVVDIYKITPDAVTFVEAVTSDGRRCILYTEFGAVQTVNGYPAEEVFEMMHFAG